MKVKGSFQEANIPCAWIGQLNTASVSILLNRTYSLQSHQNPATCFLKLILMLLINKKAMSLGHGAQYWRAHLEASDWQISCLTPKAAKINSAGRRLDNRPTKQCWEPRKRWTPKWWVSHSYAVEHLCASVSGGFKMTAAAGTTAITIAKPKVPTFMKYLTGVWKPAEEAPRGESWLNENKWSNILYNLDSKNIACPLYRLLNIPHAFRKICTED